MSEATPPTPGSGREEPAAGEDLAVIVLAAGQGTRFRSQLPKVLHRAAGRSLVGHVLEAVRPLAVGQIVVVVGHQADQVRTEVEAIGIPGLGTVVQAEQRGTGHAAQQAVPVLSERIDRVLVLFGDTPLLTSATLRRLADALDAGAQAAMLTAQVDDPTGYGRVVRDTSGTVERVVEHADASDEERGIDEINGGMYLVTRDLLVDALGRIGADNAQAEVYLPDIVAILRGDGHTVVPVLVPEDQIAGVNDRRQLADAAAVLRRRHLDTMMQDVGVTVIDPASTFVDVDVEVGRDSVLLPGTILESGTRIGERATVGPNSHLTRCDVGDDATVHSTRAVDASIGAGASVGPFTHLRPGTRLGPATKAGSFVETKNATIGEGSKVPHLSYVGDATVGAGVNVACGVITVNYDGFTKSHTTIEDGAFVGCDTMLVAPVTIGPGAYTAAGSTITDDVPADALAIARSRQVTKEGWAARRRDRDG